MKIFIVAVCIALPALASAAEGPTGIYSSYRVGKSGDLIGEEVIITKGLTAYFATVQCSEGAPGDPSLLQVEARGTAVTFVIPEDSATGCRPGVYEGSVTAKGLTLKHPQSGWRTFLVRSKSFWQ